MFGVVSAFPKTALLQRLLLLRLANSASLFGVHHKPCPLAIALLTSSTIYKKKNTVPPGHCSFCIREPRLPIPDFLCLCVCHSFSPRSPQSRFLHQSHAMELPALVLQLFCKVENNAKWRIIKRHNFNFAHSKCSLVFP